LSYPLKKELRPAYGFDDVAIAPGQITINPEMVDITMSIPDFNGGGSVDLGIPVLASAMDAIVDPQFAIHLGQVGGLAVLNLNGIHVRYEDSTEIYADIAAASLEESTPLIQKIYDEPIKEDLVAKRVEQIKAAGVKCAVATIPPTTKRLAPIASEAGADVIVIASTVTTVKHKSKSLRGLIFSEIIDQLQKPVVVGNTVSYEVTLELMHQGVSGILVGVGPGAACTSREVLGIGVPQVTATIDCAAARDEFFKRTGRYVPIITDGGIRTGGDVCKSFASGADGVMIGTPFAQAEESPGRGFNWGMATPDAALPRGTRISVGRKASLEKILFGPSSLTDGTQNLIGALRNCMGIVGAMNLQEMHKTELMLAPSIKTEGKIYQRAQGG
jgi:IMP dehydrogenase